jgi:hypothetical protein
MLCSKSFYANKTRHFEEKEARFGQKIVILQIPKLSRIQYYENEVFKKEQNKCDHARVFQKCV